MTNLYPPEDKDDIQAAYLRSFYGEPEEPDEHPFFNEVIDTREDIADTLVPPDSKNALSQVELHLNQSQKPILLAAIKDFRETDKNDLYRKYEVAIITRLLTGHAEKSRIVRALQQQHDFDTDIFSRAWNNVAALNNPHFSA